MIHCYVMPRLVVVLSCLVVVSSLSCDCPNVMFFNDLVCSVVLWYYFVRCLLCCVVLGNVMFCSVMLCCIVLCYVMLYMVCYVTLCYVISRNNNQSEKHSQEIIITPKNSIHKK